MVVREMPSAAPEKNQVRRSMYQMILLLAAQVNPTTPKDHPSQPNNPSPDTRKPPANTQQPGGAGLAQQTRAEKATSRKEDRCM